jgi:DNA-directed RNA polymerase subunit F
MTTPTTAPDVTTDVTDASALERLFRAPAEVLGNSQWVEMYDALVRALHRDSMGLPLDMAQSMLIERIASTYIRLSWFTTNGGMSDAQLDKLNETYLKYTTQFQKVLQSSDEALRQDLLKKFVGITSEVVKMIPDTTDELRAVRNQIRSFLAEEFRAIGY